VINRLHARTFPTGKNTNLARQEEKEEIPAEAGGIREIAAALDPLDLIR
jgi:hypothetical protein